MGEKPVMVGAPLVAVTVNGLLLLTPSAAGEQSRRSTPVVAPAGTLATELSRAGRGDVAAVPLKVTVFSLGVGLNPVPKIVTVVPTGPLAGLKSMSETSAELCREMLVRLPTAS